MNSILLLLCSCVCLCTHLDMDLLNEIKQMGVSLGYEGQDYASPGYLQVLFGLILYVPSTIFQLNRDGSSWVEPVLS